MPLERGRIGADMMAGITLAALGIPVVMGYTKIIGMPMVTGLYTILLPLLAFALLGSSRHLVVSSDSATAAIVGAALLGVAVPGSPRFVALAGLVAIVSGVMLLLARMTRLAFLSDFLSRTVLVGFLTGVGIQVAGGELHGMLGIDKGPPGSLRQLFHVVDNLPSLNWMDVIISATVLTVISGFGRLIPRFPAALVVVIGMIIASATLHLDAHGVETVGAVPSGLPHLGLPDVRANDIMKVLGISFSCFIVIVAQSAATSRAYATRYRDPFNENLDLVGLCFANVAAGFSGTFVVNGSPTQTAMLDSAGGRSQVAHLTTAAVVALVLLFLTGPLSHLPSAVLASIVFLIGLKLIDIRGLADILRQKPQEFALALATAATVVFLGVEQGILLASGLSLLQHVRRSYQPHTAVILNDPVEHWRMAKTAPGMMIEPGIVVYWFGADLFYANVNHFAEEARELVRDSPTPLCWLILDAGAITDIDFSAGRTLRELHEDLTKQGVGVAITRVSPGLQQDLDSLGLSQMIGENLIFSSRRECIAACRQAMAGQATTG